MPACSLLIGQYNYELWRLGETILPRMLIIVGGMERRLRSFLTVSPSVTDIPQGGHRTHQYWTTLGARPLQAEYRVSNAARI